MVLGEIEVRALIEIDPSPSRSAILVVQAEKLWCPRHLATRRVKDGQNRLQQRGCLVKVGKYQRLVPLASVN
jgi:hypothetical protein